MSHTLHNHINVNRNNFMLSFNVYYIFKKYLWITKKLRVANSNQTKYNFINDYIIYIFKLIRMKGKPSLVCETAISFKIIKPKTTPLVFVESIQRVLKIND